MQRASQGEALAANCDVRRCSFYGSAQSGLRSFSAVHVEVVARLLAPRLSEQLAEVDGLGELGEQLGGRPFSALFASAAGDVPLQRPQGALDGTGSDRLRDAGRD